MPIPEDRDDWDEDDYGEERAHGRMELVRERWIKRGWWELPSREKGGETSMFPNMLVTEVIIRAVTCPDGSGAGWSIESEWEVVVSPDWLSNHIVAARQQATCDNRHFTRLYQSPRDKEYLIQVMVLLGTIQEIGARLHAVLEVKKQMENLGQNG